MFKSLIMKVFFSFALIIMILIGFFVNNKNSMTGIYLKSINESNIIIDNNNCPIVMSNKIGKKNIFHNLKSGDKIKITYDSIEETYPAKTLIYSCKLIERGAINNIPKNVLDKLQEMGWTFDLLN